MATITGLITVNDKQILEVDANPALSSGTIASLGSIALYSDGATATLYIKNGVNDVDWSPLSTVTVEDIQDAIAAALTASANITFTYNDTLNQISADLTNTGVSAASYGIASSVPTITVDAKGRITAASNTAIAITASQVTDFNTAADARISAQKGVALGLATLDAGGKVPAAQLPSFVDDVLEFANLAAFPVTGENGVIYVALDTNVTYRWSGSVYIEISPSDVTSVFGRSGAVTAQAGDYTAAQITNTPSGSISAITVQDAINELEAEKQPLDATLTALAAFNSNGILVQTATDTFVSRSVAQGTGITVTNGSGGAGNPTIAIANTTVVAGSYGLASSVPTIVVNAQGQITSASNTAIAITSSQITDLDHGTLPGLADDDHTQYALLAGRSGGQSLTGGTASANDLTLSSTSNATKGKINLGSSSAFDEANNRLGIGSNTPESLLHLEQSNVKYNISANSTTTSGAVNAVVASVATSTDSVELLKVSITGLRTNGSNQSVAYERTLRIKNNAGTVSVLSVQSDYTSEDAALTAAAIAFIVNGTSVDVRVTGVATADISWKAVLNRMR